MFEENGTSLLIFFVTQLDDWVLCRIYKIVETQGQDEENSTSSHNRVSTESIQFNNAAPASIAENTFGPTPTDEWTKL